MGIAKLLEVHRFYDHPFATWTAEAERETDLAEWFVDPAFKEALMGNLGTPDRRLRVRSNVVLGSPGSGKTALRLTIERELIDFRQAAMVLRYIDFARPLSAGARPKLADHVDELLRLATAAILTRLHQQPNLVAKLEQSQRADLNHLVKVYWEELPNDAKEAYASSLNPLTHRVFSKAKQMAKGAIEAYNAVISILQKEKIEPADWEPWERPGKDRLPPLLRIQRLWRVAQALGFDSVWVLVDKVDEGPGCQAPQAIFDCVANILLSQTLLEFAEGNNQVLCFKIFLTHPGKIEPLLKNADFRHDRIKLDYLRWSAADLQKALSRRLAHYSNKQVLSFDSICTNEAKGTHDRLVKACEGRPRTLFRMAHEILEAFDRLGEPHTTKIGVEAVEVGIAEGRDAVFGE